MEELNDLFVKLYKKIPEIKSLAGGGSPRRYFRLTNREISVVGVIGEDITENETFLRLAEALNKAGIPVPKILAVSRSKKIYLLEDLGDTNLMSLFNEDNKLDFGKKALEKLVEIQTLPESIWEDKVGFKPFNERLVRWDLNYFKYDFLKPLGIIFDEEKLEDDFERLTKRIVSGKMLEGLMYRDFQSRNIMVKDGKFYFIDFQGARRGPMAYDAISFIWQAKAPFSYEEREYLTGFYAEILSKKLGEAREKIESDLELMEIFRTLQVLGAYGFRGLIEKKAHFLESLPLAIRNLEYLKSKGLLKDYPELSKISEGLKFFLVQNLNEEKVLTVKISSFSFKKGYPEDRTGNGGGYVFDCRGLHNPGRYEEYKSLTGKDEPVIRFLNREPEVAEFIENAFRVVRPSIETYIKRGFTSLQVNFGCTGGQHRSVFCSENFAKKVMESFPEIKVSVEHREQKEL